MGREFSKKSPSLWERLGKKIVTMALIAAATTLAFYAFQILGWTEAIAEWYLQWLLALTTGIAYYYIFKMIEASKRKRG